MRWTARAGEPVPQLKGTHEHPSLPPIAGALHALAPSLPFPILRPPHAQYCRSQPSSLLHEPPALSYSYLRHPRPSVNPRLVSSSAFHTPVCTAHAPSPALTSGTRTPSGVW